MRGASGNILEDALAFLKKVGLFLLVILIFVVGLASYAYELRLPALGFSWDGRGFVSMVYGGGPAERAGLQKEDLFLQLNGVPWKERDEFRETWEALEIGQEAVITIERDGQRMSLTLIPESRSPFLEGYGVYYLIALIFFLCSLLVYFARGGDRVARLYLLFSLVAAVAIFTNVSVSFVRWAAFLQRLGSGLVVGLFLHLSMVFPEEKGMSRRWRAFIFPLIYLPGLLLGISNGYLLAFRIEGQFNWLFKLLFLNLAFGLLEWILSLSHTYVTTPSPEIKRQLREMTVGITMTLLPFMVMLVANIWAGRALVEVRILMTSLIAFPLALTYAVLRQRSALDIDLLVNRGLVYTAWGLTLTAIYLLLVAGISWLLGLEVPWKGLFVAAVSALTIAFIAAPLRGKLQALVDRLFYRR